MYKRREILNFVEKDFPQYTSSVGTLDQHLRYFEIYYSGSFHLLSAPPLWMSSGQNFTCRNRTSEMYPIGMDSKYLNPRHLDLFSKNLSIYYLHHLYRLAFVVILPVGIGLQRSTPVGIDGKGGFTMK